MTEAALLFGELLRPADAVLGRQGIEPVGIERFDDRPNVRCREVESSGDVGNFGPLVGGQNDLSSANLDPVLVSTNDALKSSPLGETDVPDVKAHNKSPHVRLTSLSTRGTPYILADGMAQITYLNKSPITFLETALV